MKGKQIIVFLSTFISLFGIYWINAGKTSLKRTADVAGREEVVNYTLPPDFSFSIWGFIYLGFLIYAFYGLKKNTAVQPFFVRTAYPVALSILFNLLWTVIVGLELWLVAYPLQWLMLVVAIITMFRFDFQNEKTSAIQKWLSIPFALYAGWLTVAMIPFTSDLLNKSGWNYAPFEPKTWAIILYVVACVISLAAYKKLKHPFYLLPLAWAFFGFFIRFDGQLKLVAGVLGIVVLLFMAVKMPGFFRRSSGIVFT